VVYYQSQLTQWVVTRLWVSFLIVQGEINLSTMSRLETLCIEKGMKMTGQRRVIARVLSDSDDHPDVEEVYARASAIDPKISIATVYRTVRLFEEAEILERHDFGDGRSRYEEVSDEHHDHLIDIRTREVIEFQDPEIEKLQAEIARRLGFKLVGHRLELYGVRDGEEKS
jgi:Fur family transcriptional regulator, ferric uptake regulator